MSNLNTSSSRWGRVRYNFKYFASFQDWVDEIYKAKRLIEENNRQGGQTISDTYPSRLERFQTLKDYSEKDELFTKLDQLETAIAEIEMGGVTKKDRLLITSDERGVFSFGLASRGLYKPMEYFSSELAIDSPNEFPEKPSGVVPDRLVESITIFKKTQFWYESPKTKKRYELTQQQEGTREVNLGERTLPIFRTKTKKSYVILPKKTGKAKLVEIYVPLHGSIGLDDILPLYFVIKYLRQQNISVKVNSTRIVGLDGEWVMWTVPVKDYGDEIDYNRIALTTVDGNWWNAIADSVLIIRNWEQKSRTGLFDWGNYPDYTQDEMEMFARYKNWFLDEMQKGNLEPTRVDKKLLLFGRTRDHSLEGQIKQFYKIIDKVDFQFNKEEYCFKKIFKREVEDKLQNYYLELKKARKNGINSLTDKEINDLVENKRNSFINEFRRYIIQLFVDTYYYPIDGFYKESKESAEQLEKEYEEKYEKLLNYLSTI